MRREIGVIGPGQMGAAMAGEPCKPQAGRCWAGMPTRRPGRW